MILTVQSTPWLLAHEIRLAWRGLARGRLALRRPAALVLIFLLLTGVGGVPLGLALRHARLVMSTATVVVADLALAALFTLMLSQALAASVDALYWRGDLDLLFSSPTAPAKVLTVRCAATATTIFAGFALLISPFLLPLAALGHPAWLAAYLVLAALAAAATAAALVATVGLLRAIGPRRTRAVGQILAAVVGAAFFLASQAYNLTGHARLSGLVGAVRRQAGDGALPPLVAWPARALVGELGPLLGVVAAASLLFAAATLWIGRRFAADAAAASGVGAARAGRGGLAAPFAAGAFTVTVRKEWRLLGRDAGLLAKVLLRLLYLLPFTFVLLRTPAGHLASRLPAGVGLVSFMAGYAAGSLAWITISAEDAPELIASAPVSPGVILRAKLTAALAPLGVLLAAPIIALTVIAPVAGLAALIGSAGAALAAGLMQARFHKPARRSAFSRPGAVALSAIAAQFLICGLIAAGAALAAAASPWALGPWALAAVALACLRRPAISSRGRRSGPASPPSGA